MGTKWNKYNRCPYCSSTRIKNKHDEIWYCLKCKKIWNGEKTLGPNFISNSSYLSGWSLHIPNDSWIIFKNDAWTILGNDFYFNEYNPSRRDSK